WVSMVANTLQIAQDPKGYMGFDLGFLGAKQQNSTGAPYFTSPAAITNNRLHNVLDGALYLGGTLIADVTGLTLNIDHQGQLADPTYGTRNPSEEFPGRIKVGGNM